MSASCECCLLSGRGLCDELFTRPEESYRLWCVVVCDQETSRMWRSWPALGRSVTGGKNIQYYRLLLAFTFNVLVLFTIPVSCNGSFCCPTENIYTYLFISADR